MRNNRRHFPADIVEEVLLNLPAKSLLRFSSVSKSWKTMIFDRGFIKKYRRRSATLPARQRLATLSGSYYLHNISCYSIPSTSSTAARDFIWKVEGKAYLHASYDELCCVEIENSLYLWNPSTGAKRMLPCPSLSPWSLKHIVSHASLFAYGLGYDPVGDDYKILKLNEHPELYSLTSDSWKRIQPFDEAHIHRKPLYYPVYVGGALHWTVNSECIASFDLSNETYTTRMPPDYSPALGYMDSAAATVLRGKLFVSVNYYRTSRFVLWMMADYGVRTSWVNVFDVNYCNSFTQFLGGPTTGSSITLRPLYFYNNGEILFLVHGLVGFNLGVFLFKDAKSVPRRIINGATHNDAFHFIESFVSPLMWPTTPPKIVGNINN